jgi:hypothetical protein
MGGIRLNGLLWSGESLAITAVQLSGAKWESAVRLPDYGPRCNATLEVQCVNILYQNVG